MQFEQVMMPAGTPKCRKMWLAVDRGNYAGFYPIGRKGRFWVTWGTPYVSGGEQRDCREDAEHRAGEILRRLAS